MKQLIFSILLVLSLSACTKEKQNTLENEPVCTEGTIRWGGEPAVDGIGWYYETPAFSRSVKLENVPPDFFIDGLAVTACLLRTDRKYGCFCGTPLDVYDVFTIQRR
jgi:hypothetical protein